MRARESDAEQPLTAAQYASSLAWQVEVRGDLLVLPLPAGWVGVHALAEVGAAACGHPLLHDACGPVLALPGTDRRWVFLAEADDAVLARPYLPTGVGVFRSPHALPLPPSVIDAGMVRWALPPVPTRRWLPGASAVVAALTEVLAPRRQPGFRRSRTPSPPAWDRMTGWPD